MAENQGKFDTLEDKCYNELSVKEMIIITDL